MVQNSANDKLVRYAFRPDMHYSTLQKWLAVHDVEAPELSRLPTNGIVIAENRSPVCMAFMYRTDSNSCFLDWVAYNSFADDKARGNSLKYLLESVTEWTKQSGHDIIFVNPFDDVLSDALAKSGFVKTQYGDKMQKEVYI